jgi:maltose-binding protein MalE
MSDEMFRWVVAGGVMIAALSFLIVGIVAVVFAVMANKIKMKIEPLLDAARPIAHQVQDTVAVLTPKIVKISDRAVELTNMVVTEAHRYSELSKDVAERAKVQVARLDGKVDETVEKVEEATESVKEAVLQPIRQMDGVWAGVRTAVSTYVHGNRRSVNRVTQDEEMFI